MRVYLDCPNQGIVFLLFAAFAGCGSPGPFEYVKVSGTAHYDNGQPLPDSVKVRFKSLDAEAIGTAHPRIALAHLKNGVFEVVTSYKYGDGLIPGEHQVFFEQATDDAGNLFVPESYLRPSTSPLTINTADSPFEIKVPVPPPAAKKARRR